MNATQVEARLDVSRWLWKLGASPRDSLALVASYNSRVVRKRLRLPGVQRVTVRLKHGGQALPFTFHDASDFVVLKEVFREQQYRLPSSVKPKVVLDLGANTGLSPLYFHGAFPDARIVAVEAHPETFRRLSHNAKQWEKVEPLHLAAAESNGDIQLYGSPDRSISSSIFQRTGSTEGSSPTTVRAESLCSLLRRCGGHIGLLKFDIEGAELGLFSGFRQWESVDVLIGEVHPDLYGGSLEEFFALFPRHTPTILSRWDARAVVRFDPQ